MATPVGRIEKEFLFKLLYEEKHPIIYVKDKVEYTFTLEYPVIEEFVLRPTKPISKIKNYSKPAFLFNIRGQVIDFHAEVIKHKDSLLYCKIPEMLYKNLDRNYLRVDAPVDMKINFTFKGDRYNLSFPKVMEYENVDAQNIAKNFNYNNMSVLIKQIASLLSKFADKYKIINFKDRKPETTEEHIISETGKTLFIPTTVGFLPNTDPYPKKRIITEEMFKRYLETTGVGKSFLDDNCARFLRNKFEDGIYSEAWVPVLFHEYVIGYIRIWIDKQGRLPFDFSVLDHVYQYAKVLAFALKENGYFEHGRMENESFDGRVLDISASGLLFVCPLGARLLPTLLIDAELTVTIETSERTINVIAKIVRRFKDKNGGYLGCRFINMEPEDTRFLFEHLYGRQIDAADTAFLAGQV